MKFDAMASAKVYQGKPEDTEKNLRILEQKAKEGVLCSVKWDGWRLFEYNHQVHCRSMKPPKNKPTRKYMAELYASAAELGVRGIDGEGIVGDIYDRNAMQHSSSMFNSDYNDVPFTYLVFDSYQFRDWAFEKRLDHVTEAVLKLQPQFPWIQPVEHKLLTHIDDVMAFLQEVEDRGGEGIMGRSRDGRYKFGRSTMKEGWLWALKPYVDDEAIIVGFEEELENQNEATINERGYTSRAGLKENLVPKGRLGKFICRSDKFPEQFSVGAGVGLTHELRQYVWDNQELYLGQFVKYKYQAIGCKERPRQPKFMGIRPAIDMPAEKVALLRGIVG